ncbi:MAG TPA: metallophosphoesterase, partial [Chroococcales cyanobacterium]
TLQLLTAGKLIDSNQRWIGGRSLLVIVGDSIDEGPKSIEVLDLWAALSTQAKAAGGLVIPLLGNHEAEFLADPSGDSKAQALRDELKQLNIPITDLTDPSTSRGSFIHGMPLAARVGSWLFCHAGLLPDISWAQFGTQAASVLGKSDYGNAFLLGPDSVLEAKDWWVDPAARSAYEKRLASISIFGVVQGHQPKAYNIPYDIGSLDGGHLIKIDNGMAPKSGSNPGHLLLFPNPSEMKKNVFPTVQSIAPNGGVKLVVPLN